MKPLVTTAWLADHLNDPDVRIIDARWYLLDTKKGEAAYHTAHIPNAVYLSVDRHLAAPPPPRAATGRHPLPSESEFARAWWLLRYFGHENAALLDGGITQWIAEGRPLTAAVPSHPRGNFHGRPNTDMFVTKEQMQALLRDPRALILDARAPERYRGDIEPVDARAGHIPGAKNAPLSGNLVAPDDLRFKQPGQIQSRFDQFGANGADQIVAYCGSGINAAADIFALHLAGYEDAKLYPGSFSEWSRDPSLPIITGDTPY